MKMLPREYDKAQGEPFRVEEYKGAKLEMYYLDDRSDYAKFASRGRFSVWTSDGVGYRLFVDKGYYNAVSGLYRNDVNDIWLDFTNNIYGEQKRLSNRYMMVSFILLFVILGASFLIQEFFPQIGQDTFLYSMVFLFIGLFFSSSMQQKKLKALVQEENAKATSLIRQAVGEENFQDILNAQEKYYQEYFNVEPDPVDEENPEALEAPQDAIDAEVEETSKEEENE